MALRLLVLPFFLLCLLLAPAAAERDWFVDQAGRDAGNGTFVDPFATVAQAAARAASGDSILLSNGEHSINATIDLSDLANITIRSQTSGGNGCLASVGWLPPSWLRVVNEVELGLQVGSGESFRMIETGFRGCPHVCVDVTGASKVELTCTLFTEATLGVRTNNAHVLSRNSLFHNNGRVVSSIEGSCLNILAGSWTCQDSVFADNFSLLDGGAVQCASAPIVMRNCSFIRNNATDDGSAMNLEPNTQDVIIEDSLFSNNIAGDSGGIRVKRGDYEFIVRRTIFEKNTAFEGSGMIVSPSSFVIEDTEFRFNRAFDRGAAISCEEDEGAVEGIVRRVVFSDNVAPIGGALYINSLASSVVEIQSSTFVNNSASDGGAIFVEGSTILLEGCNFTLNSASRDGGALAVRYSAFAGEDGLKVSNSLFAANVAGRDGGSLLFNDIRASEENVPFSVENCDISGGRATQGGAIKFEARYVSMTNLSITSCSAAGSGGAVHVGVDALHCIDPSKPGQSGSLSPFLSGVVIKSCFAAQSGGAIAFSEDFPRCPVSFESDVLMRTWSDNSAGDFGATLATDARRIRLARELPDKTCREEEFAVVVNLVDYFENIVVGRADLTAQVTTSGGKLSAEQSSVGANASGYFVFPNIGINEDGLPDPVAVIVTILVPNPWSRDRQETAAGSRLLAMSAAVNVDFCDDFLDLSGKTGSQILAIFALFAVIVGFVLWALVTVAFFYFRKRRLFRRSKRRLLAFVSAGVLLVLVGAALKINRATVGSCYFSRAFIELGFAVLVGGAFAKAARDYYSTKRKGSMNGTTGTSEYYYYVSDDETDRSVDAQKDANLQHYLCGIIGVSVILLIIYVAVWQVEVHGGHCVNKRDTFSVMLIFYRVLMIVIFCYTTWLGRKLSMLFNETSWLGLGAGAIGIATLILIIFQLVDMSFSALLLLEVLLLIAPVVGCYILLIGPKLYLILRDEEDRAFEVKKALEPRQIAFVDLEINNKELARGQFGVVYTGTYFDNLCVVKMLQDDLPDLKELERQRLRSECLAEAVQLTMVPHYPSIVSFFGLSEDPDNRLYLVSEYIEGGSLNSLLQEPSVKLCDIDYHTVAANLAGAMKLLHSEGILHLDLATRNLLVSRRNPLSVKLTDFGLSDNIPEGFDGIRAADRLYSVRWYDPPVTGFFTRKSDVYAFGVVLWELFERDRPWGDMTNMQVTRAIIAGEHLPKPRRSKPASKACAKWFYELMLSCWEKDLEERPNFGPISAQLKRARLDLFSTHFYTEPASPASATAHELGVSLQSNYGRTPIESTSVQSIYVSWSGKLADASSKASTKDSTSDGYGSASLKSRKSHISRTTTESRAAADDADDFEQQVRSHRDKKERTKHKDANPPMSSELEDSGGYGVPIKVKRSRMLPSNDISHRSTQPLKNDFEMNSTEPDQTASKRTDSSSAGSSAAVLTVASSATSAPSSTSTTSAPSSASTTSVSSASSASSASSESSASESFAASASASDEGAAPASKSANDVPESGQRDDDPRNDYAKMPNLSPLIRARRNEERNRDGASFESRVQGHSHLSCSGDE